MVRKPSEWLKIVKEYHTSNISMTKLANKYGVDSAKLKYLIKLYDLHGEKPFTDEQQDRVYTREEKLKAIEEYLSGTKSGRQIALEMGSPSADIVRDWARLFKSGGSDAI